MGDVIGGLLPLAAGIAFSPIPIIATILMVLSPRSRQTSTAFLAGWMVGIVVATIIFALMGNSVSNRDPDTSRPIAGIVQLVLGMALIFLAWRQWQARPHPGEKAKRPGWMSAIDQFSVAQAFGIGFLLTALNLKNVMYEASAGVLIGHAELSYTQMAVVLAVFAFLSSLTVLGPIVAQMVAPEKVTTPLESARNWLEQNNATIMTIVLLLIGITIVGKGIASF